MRLADIIGLRFQTALRNEINASTAKCPECGSTDTKLLNGKGCCNACGKTFESCGLNSSIRAAEKYIKTLDVKDQEGCDLDKGSADKTISRNIKKLMDKNVPQEKAVAIAYSKAGRSQEAVAIVAQMYRSGVVEAGGPGSGRRPGFGSFLDKVHDSKIGKRIGAFANFMTDHAEATGQASDHFKAADAHEKAAQDHLGMARQHRSTGAKLVSLGQRFADTVTGHPKAY